MMTIRRTRHLVEQYFSLLIGNYCKKRIISIREKKKFLSVFIKVSIVSHKLVHGNRDLLYSTFWSRILSLQLISTYRPII